MVLIDTDIMVDLLRQYLPAVAWLRSLDDKEISLPGFVVMELIQGCSNHTEQNRLEKELSSYSAIWHSIETCDKALSVFIRFHLTNNLGVLDALVGQTAVALNLALHTFNQKHYAVIPGLQTIQPYKK
ncbi:PIN domain-containing protein [bacterium]|nr:PIN domain-containing protein [bacterium]MBU1599235.1 PIN domain-containing protein [bacterium]